MSSQLHSYYFLDIGDLTATGSKRGSGVIKASELEIDRPTPSDELES